MRAPFTLANIANVTLFLIYGFKNNSLHLVFDSNVDTIEAKCVLDGRTNFTLIFPSVQSEELCPY